MDGIVRAAAFSLAIALCGPAFAAGRSATPLLPEPPYSYALPALPEHRLADEAMLAEFPAISDAGATLGRVLFHDRGLSANGLVACASCHSQENSFDDRNRFSIGFAGRITRRSAMSLANAAVNPSGRFFRDQRAASLQDQVLQPLTDETEMGLRPGEVVERVAARSWYAPLFAAAFGDETISEARIASALAQFVTSLVSVRSAYDLARPSAGDPRDPFAAFSEEENRGKFLFLAGREAGGAGCASCHETEWFVLTEPRDNGLPPLAGRDDGGVGEVSGRPEDAGKFRAPSLRNVAVSAPYMRDGRFKTLEEVVAHYSDGIAATANLDMRLRDADGRPLRLGLSPADRRALVAFLRTLTDKEFLTDPRFSDPFRTD